MTLFIPTGGTGISGIALGLGVLLFFGAYLAPRGGEGDLTQRLSLAGFVTASALAGGLFASLAVGELGLSSLGAILGGGLAALWLPGPLGLRRGATLDLLIPAGLAGLSVARLGCLLQGCDFGSVTESPLAVTYPSGTRAWAYHVAAFGHPMMSRESLPVHPFGLYLGIWGLTSAALGVWWRRREATPGRAGLAAAALFLAGGGMIEWLREPLTVPHFASGLSIYPIIYVTAAGLLFLLWRRLKI